MYFLSHYYIEKDRINPPFLLGLIAPDLAPGFNRNYKKAAINLNINNTYLQLEYGKGVKRHIAVDATFHNSPYFSEKTGSIKEILKITGADKGNPRIYFLVHLILELMIDRLLAKQFPGISVEFYEQLEQLGQEEIHEIMQIYPPLLLKDFMYIYDRFKNRRHLSNFNEPETVAMAVVRTYNIVVKEHDALLQLKLTELVHSFDKLLMPDLLPQLEIIKKNIPG